MPNMSLTHLPNSLETKKSRNILIKRAIHTIQEAEKLQVKSQDVIYEYEPSAITALFESSIIESNEPKAESEIKNSFKRRKTKESIEESINSLSFFPNSSSYLKSKIKTPEIKGDTND